MRQRAESTLKHGYEGASAGYGAEHVVSAYPWCELGKTTVVGVSAQKACGPLLRTLNTILLLTILRWLAPSLHVRSHRRGLSIPPPHFPGPRRHPHTCRHQRRVLPPHRMGEADDAQFFHVTDRGSVVLLLSHGLFTALQTSAVCKYCGHSSRQCAVGLVWSSTTVHCQSRGAANGSGSAACEVCIRSCRRL